MSCGHLSHISCLIKLAKEKAKDNAECPECREFFTLDEVPVPVRSLLQRKLDKIRISRFNASQTRGTLSHEEEDSSPPQISSPQIRYTLPSDIPRSNDQIRAFIRQIVDLYSSNKRLATPEEFDQMNYYVRQIGILMRLNGEEERESLYDTIELLRKMPIKFITRENNPATDPKNSNQ
jgi:hypothetical protein